MCFEWIDPLIIYISISVAALSLSTCLHGLSTSHVVWVVEVRDPGLGSVAHVHVQFVGAFQFSKLLLQVTDNLDNAKEKYEWNQSTKKITSKSLTAVIDENCRDTQQLQRLLNMLGQTEARLYYFWMATVQPRLRLIEILSRNTSLLMLIQCPF